MINPVVGGVGVLESVLSVLPLSAGQRALWLPAWQQAAATGWRRVLVLEGEASWARDLARRCGLADLTGQAQALWVGNVVDRRGAVAPAQALQWLGREVSLLVWDSFAGLHPDGFAALAGTLRGDGLLIWLVPPLQDWSQFPDPDYQRFTREPLPERRFLGWLARQLAAVGGEVLRVTPAGAQACPARSGMGLTGVQGAAAPLRPGEPLPDQRAVIQSVLRLVSGHAHRPLLLTADRGRGKSAALGMAAAQRLAEEGGELLVVAPRRSAVSVLWQHCRCALSDHGVAFSEAPAGEAPAGDLITANGRLQFMAVDALLRERPVATLLLVDEAAALPLPLLQRLLLHYPRVVLSTTVQGYEGSGRGFELRLRPFLDARLPGWRSIVLTKPVRWAEDDPLESLLNHALLLDAELLDAELLAVALPDAEMPARLPLSAAPLTVSPLSGAALMADPVQLRAVFGLLRCAHYRTRPDDLRQLLDDPAGSLLVARAGDQLVGVLWWLQEGSLPVDLAQAVALGLRRPQGHLLPQLLALQAADPALAQWRYARIIRIAVHPAWRRRGVGVQLVAHLRARVDLDVLGTSFGAATDLLAFWLACGLRPLRLGLKAEASSGRHALAMALPLSTSLADGAALGLSGLAARFAQQWPILLLTRLRELDPELALALSAQWLPAVDLSVEDRQELRAFVDGQRPLESSVLVLQRLGRAACSSVWADYDEFARALWVRAVLQGWTWAELGCFHPGGRQSLEGQLRVLAKACLAGHSVSFVTGSLMVTGWQQLIETQTDIDKQSIFPE